jgi:imidazolonepropionase-like amidohydrolase
VILQRNLLLTLRWFLRHGYSRQDAVELVTRRNAEILGMEASLGTIEDGKLASFICWNGDPFDLASYPVEVYGEGEVRFSAESGR